MNRMEIGKLGEKYAANFLNSRNYKIIKRNYYTKYGEIDLITFDYSTKEMVFVEVKTRTSDRFGTPEESFTREKKNHFVKTMFQYLEMQKKSGLIWRIDLITLILNNEYGFEEINHYKNIFDGD